MRKRSRKTKALTAAPKVRTSHSVNELKKECPRCHKTKPLESGFGVRKFRGQVYAQSYCRECRGSDSVPTQTKR